MKFEVDELFIMTSDHLKPFCVRLENAGQDKLHDLGEIIVHVLS